MTICCIHQGQRRTYTFEKDEVIIGRTAGRDDPELRLDYDLRVSRHHARLFRRDGKVFVEDLDSRSGVFVNHAHIESPWALKPGDLIRIGDTLLCLEAPTYSMSQETGAKNARMQASVPPARLFENTEPTYAESHSGEVEIHGQVDAWHRKLFFAPVVGKQFVDRLQVLYDLPVEFASIEDRNELFETILARAIELIPGCERGALLSFEADSGKLALRCCIPADQPPLSRRLVKKTAADGGGIIWSHKVDDCLQSGLYAPIIWGERVIGVVCVDSPKVDEEFDEVDLKILLALARYAAAALALRGWME